MSSDPNQYYQERQQKNLEEREQGFKGTLETYNLEQKQADHSALPIPPFVINLLAFIGAMAIVYLIANLIF